MGLADAIRAKADQDRLAALAALTAGNTAAQTGTTNATSGLQNAQTASTTAATQGVGAPQADEITRIIQAGYAPQLAALATRGSTDANFYGALGTGVNTRFAGIQQGINAAETGLQQKIDAKTAGGGGSSGGGGGGGGGGGRRGGGKTAAAATSLGDNGLPSADSFPAFNPLKPSAFFKGVGGEANFKQVINDNIGVQKDYQGKVPPSGSPAAVASFFSGLPPIPQMQNRGQTDRYVAQTYGVPAKYSKKLFPATTTQHQGPVPKLTQAQYQDVASLTSKSAAAKYVAAGQKRAQQAIRQGNLTRAQFAAQAAAQAKHSGISPKLVQLLLAIYGPQFKK